MLTFMLTKGYAACKFMLGFATPQHCHCSIMMTGSILLVFTPLVPNPGGYLDMFIVAQTW